MKKTDFLILFLVIAFFISMLVCAYFQIFWLAYLFLGLTLGVVFLAIIITHIVAFVYALKREKTLTTETEKEIIDKVNSTYGIENILCYAEYNYIFFLHLYNSANKKANLIRILARIIGALCFFAGIILLCLNYLAAGIICIVFYAAILIISGIVFSVKSHLILSRKDIDYTTPKQAATIIYCTREMASIRMTPGAMRLYSFIYKIKVDLNGEEKITYSRIFYNSGDTVNVFTDKYKKKVFVDDKI